MACGVQVRVFKDLIRQKEHMVLPDLAQDLAQVRSCQARVLCPCFLQTFGMTKNHNVPLFRSSCFHSSMAGEGAL